MGFMEPCGGQVGEPKNEIFLKEAGCLPDIHKQHKLNITNHKYVQLLSNMQVIKKDLLNSTEIHSDTE